MKKPTYIGDLFDSINGGDDVDAAAEAQQIAEELLEACRLAFKQLKPGHVRKDFAGHVAKAALGTAIRKAEGWKS